MTTATNRTLIIGLIAALFVVICLWGYTCNKAKGELQTAQDSLNVHKAVTEKVIQDTARLARERDSLMVEKSIADYRDKLKQDSMVNAISLLRGRFSIAKDSIGALYKQLRTLYEAGDTTALQTAYFSLGSQLDSATARVKLLEETHDSLDQAKSDEIARLNGTIDTLKGQLNRAFLLLNTQIANSKSEEGATQKLINKQKKAKVWALLEKIGIGIAGLFIGSKL